MSVLNIFSLLQGNFITASHYADIVEERMLSKKCGYPLCNNELNQVSSCYPLKSLSGTLAGKINSE